MTAHCEPGRVKVLVYHGMVAKKLRNKANIKQYFQRYAFVFTTYDTVRSEYAVIEKRREWEAKAQEKRETGENQDHNTNSDEESKSGPSAKQKPDEGHLQSALEEDEDAEARKFLADGV